MWLGPSRPHSPRVEAKVFSICIVLTFFNFFIINNEELLILSNVL